MIYLQGNRRKHPTHLFETSACLKATFNIPTKEVNVCKKDVKDSKLVVLGRHSKDRMHSSSAVNEETRPKKSPHAHVNDLVTSKLLNRW